MPARKLPDDATLAAHFQKEGLGHREIAEMYGVTRQAVYARLNRMGVETPPRRQKVTLSDYLPWGVEPHHRWHPVRRMVALQFKRGNGNHLSAGNSRLLDAWLDYLGGDNPTRTPLAVDYTPQAGFRLVPGRHDDVNLMRQPGADAYRAVPAVSAQPAGAQSATAAAHYRTYIATVLLTAGYDPGIANPAALRAVGLSEVAAAAAVDLAATPRHPASDPADDQRTASALRLLATVIAEQVSRNALQGLASPATRPASEPRRNPELTPEQRRAVRGWANYIGTATT